MGDVGTAAAEGPVLPDYTGAWVGALVPGLLGGVEVPWLPATARDADQVVLLVLDGLGWTALQSRQGRLPAFAGMDGRAITTVGPTTTSAALTSISTGWPPAGHGIVGYRMRVGGQILNVLGWYVAGGEAPDPAGVQRRPPFLGRQVPVVTRAEFRTTGFTAAHLRDTDLIGWTTPSVLVEHVRRLVAGGRRFTYAYYDGIDKVAHEHGLSNGFFDAEVAAADRLVGDLLEVLPDSCALVVTADHGQVEVAPDQSTGLDGVHRLVQAYSGEGRFRGLHARTGASADLLAAARERFAAQAWVLARDQLFDEGWLGDGATAEVRGRVGDVVLAARTPTVFVDPGSPYEAQMRSQHGSFTPDEVLVPLLAARGRA